MFTIIGNSQPIEKIRIFIKKCGGNRLPVLIEGESGTGKELVARAIHEATFGDKAPFIAINCGSMPADLLENELFGHEKGAFTGATGEKPGLLEAAEGGSIFLDEIGEMSPQLQAKLLRAIEYGTFRRLGAVNESKYNARIIAATNKLLEQEIKKGGFREDLFYRRSVLRLMMPPLRERRDDIPILSEYFITQGGFTKNLEQSAIDELKKHIWPGNIRQLRNVISSACVFSDEQSLSAESIKAAIGSPSNPKPVDPVTPSASETSFRDFMEDAEKSFLLRALEKYGDNKTQMAKALNITRDMLYRKLNKHGL